MTLEQTKETYGPQIGSVQFNGKILRLHCQPEYKGEKFCETIDNIVFNIVDDGGSLHQTFKLDGNVTDGPQNLICFLAKCL